ncbi:hypothetical protein [Streptomyces geranii]|uniref:hypothetical protein n=1 Tax=Streptomyces geranii TaxID=2058923 RepID=UPI000D037B85|nr:hypothetical protein [Streptomyces geranii]
MAFTRLKNRSIKGRAAGTIAVLTLGASLIAAPSASADTDPGPARLLQACNNHETDVCEFHPQSYTSYIGPIHTVGDLLYNCGRNVNTTTVNWTDTTGSTNSVGVSLGASMEIEKIFKIEIETTYTHTWLTSHTTGQTTTINVSPGDVGWIKRGTAKQQATGWWEIHFGKRFYGHYIWYINNYKESGPTGKTGFVAPDDRVMTSAERSSHCR